MKKRYSVFILLAFLFFASFSFAGHFASAATSKQPQSQLAGVWQSILSFFGLNNDTDTAKQNSTSSNNPHQNGSVVSGDELIGSNPDRVRKEQAGASADSELVRSGQPNSENLLCLPSIKYKDEPAIIAYRCPTGLSFDSSSFNTKEDSGILIKSSFNGEEYILCKSSDNSKEKRFSCSVKEIDPQVLNFSISPAKPQAGQTVLLTLKTRDMSTCFVRNTDGSVSQRGLNFEFNFVNKKEHDSFVLSCKDESGLETKKIIKY